jgi:lipopolysaccharide export system protein LptA
MLRRYSLLLSSAAVLLALFVTYTYVHRAARDRQHAPKEVTRIPAGLQATGTTYKWGKDDPETNCPIVRATAKSFEAVQDPSTFQLTDMQLRLYNKGCSSYTYVQTSKADFDESSGLMTSKGDVLIIMKVPTDKQPDDQQATEKLIHIRTSGVRYETKSGKVDTNAPAAFQFANGNGKAVGADYDPNTHDLHMKSQVALDWVGKGAAADAMHIEAGELRYDETKGKVYLWPWSRLKRHSTVINAAASEVTLDQGVLQRVDSLDATGTDDEETRHVEYGAKTMVALFNDDGDMTQITAQPEARLLSTDAASKTSMTANQAVLQFDIQPETVNGEERHNSLLHRAVATGNAIVDSSPVPREHVKPSDTRILRSESIEILMKPGGREIQALSTNAPAELEFKPNQPDRAHRWMNGERIQIAYGDANSVDAFRATKASTRTEKPIAAERRVGKDGKPAPPPPPALTWSDELSAKFVPGSNDLATLEQDGNFRYEEGLRHATADKAFLEQASNKITLTGAARVWDDTGSTLGDSILLSQQNGDMDAIGNVASTRRPDQQKGKQNASLLDQSRPLQARADKMQTRDNNLKIRYEGHAVLWQGANRLQGDLVLIDRDEETLHATGNVISQLVDKQDNQTTQQPGVAPDVRLQPVVDKTPTDKTSAPTGKNRVTIFTVVHAPELFYQDDQRLAHYRGGVSLVRDKMTVTSSELRAFLTKEDTGENGNNDSDGGTSLDHALADGNVKVVQTTGGRTRTGTSEHCEYFPKDNKVILNGGLPMMSDTRKGTTVGRQLTYYSNTDHVVVEGVTKKPVVTDMNRQKK